MSLPVDVLAVMARDAADAYCERNAGDKGWAEELGMDSMKARAAVAELIEAAEWADRMIAQHARNEDGQKLDTIPLRAALARVRGAA